MRDEDLQTVFGSLLHQACPAGLHLALECGRRSCLLSSGPKSKLGLEEFHFNILSCVDFKNAVLFLVFKYTVNSDTGDKR